MMEEGLASHQIKLLPLAILLLLLQPPPASATTTSPITASTVINAGGGVLAAGEATTKDGSITTSESQGSNTQLPTAEQPNTSDPPFLQGITLTAIIVVSILGGLTSLIVCVVVSVAIAVLIKRWKLKRNRRESSTPCTHAHTSAVNIEWPDFDMTNNTAYHSGQLGRATTGNVNAYTTRPSSRASATQNNQPETLTLPGRYLQAPSNRVDVSVDSLGYVKLPKPRN